MSRIEEALAKAAKVRETARNEACENVATGTVATGTVKPAVRTLRMTASDNPEVENPMLVSANQIQSPMAEEYRKLKEMLLKLTRQGESGNTLMITSAKVGEGKTTTALNLAISLAQEYDHTVLLIDADLRKPSIERYLGLGKKKGLAEYLLNGTNMADVLVETGIGKLMILPAGKSVSNPGELFSSRKMRDMIMEMKHRYKDRFIIIDTPPVLPFAETRTMSGIVDGVVMVVKAGQTDLDNIQDALTAMHGANILGLVFNQVPLEAMNTSYAHYYKDYGY